MSNDSEKKKGARIREPFVPIANEVFENLVPKWPLSLPARRFAEVFATLKGTGYTMKEYA